MIFTVMQKCPTANFLRLRLCFLLMFHVEETDRIFGIFTIRQRKSFLCAWWKPIINLKHELDYAPSFIEPHKNQRTAKHTKHKKLIHSRMGDSFFLKYSKCE